MKSELRRSDFCDFGFCSVKENSELSPTSEKGNCEHRSERKA